MSDSSPQPRKWARGLARPIFYLGNNRLSQAGVVITTASALTLVSFYLAEVFGFRPSPYVGIIGFLILPAVFVGGLLLIPLGMHRRRRKEIQRGTLPREYPRIDLNQPQLRQTFYFVAGATAVNLLLFLTASYRGVHYMDSVQFCGLTCHSVMQPEYTAYQNSPHARVACVQCHIGPGAPWFVRSKLSGAWQVVSVTLDLYERPIPTPVENLRPSQDTCEQCHWPAKFHGDKIVVKPHFADDEQNSFTRTVLSMHIGGVDPMTGEIKGIHGAHLDSGNRITYISTDRQRQEIPYVRYSAPDGNIYEYFSMDAPPLEELLATGEQRRMDCMDCHNRPTHIFKLPGEALDQALAAKRIDPSLPFIKMKGLEFLQLSYTSRAEAASQIRTRLRDFYRREHPELFNSPRRGEIEQAATALVEIYQRNVFPQMNLFWGTYPDNRGHDPFPGCFRCHDGVHSTRDESRTIPGDCDTCHTLLAYEEEDPEILRTLRGE